MENVNVKLSASARKFMQERDLRDVTFNLIESQTGCCVGIIKEIEPVYKAPNNASGYRYFHVDDWHIFISRKIKVMGPLTLTTEGAWKMKRLSLRGATVPL